MNRRKSAPRTDPPASPDLLPDSGGRLVLHPKSYAAFIVEAPCRDESEAVDFAGEAALRSMPDGLEGYSVDALARPSSPGSTTVLLRLCPRSRLVEAAAGSGRRVTTPEDWLVGAPAGLYLFAAAALCLGFRVSDGFPRERAMALADSAEGESLVLAALQANPAEPPDRISLEPGAPGRPLADFLASRPSRYPLYPEARQRKRARRIFAVSALALFLFSALAFLSARTEAAYEQRVAKLGRLFAAYEAETRLHTASPPLAGQGGAAPAERAARSLRAGLSALFSALGAEDRLRSLSLSSDGFELEGFLKDPWDFARRLEATGFYDRISVVEAGHGVPGKPFCSLVGSAARDE